MKKLFSGFNKGEKGFTLIELLVVIAILGILAAVAIPNLAKFMSSGKQQAADTELSIVQTDVVALMADNANDGVAFAAQTTGITGNGGGALLLTPYLSSDLAGTYTWDIFGKVTQVTYPGVNATTTAPA